MDINYDVWIQGEPAYTGLNTRTGTAAITDQDYEDFAPFTLAYYPTGANKYTMWNWLNGGELSMDSEIDMSMCYVGMYNSDLPQLNIGAYAFDTYDTIDNPMYQTDNTQIQSFFFIDTWNFFFQQTYTANYRQYADSRLYTKDFNYTNYKYQIYKDGLSGTQPHITPALTLNIHGALNVYLIFGIKSLILEINVVYKTSDGTYYPNIDRCTLAAYEANNTAWKEAHPILQAYCVPYIRDNTNGHYSHSAHSFESFSCPQTFTPAFTLPYISKASGYDDIVTYNTSLTTQTVNGFFPLYGAVVGDQSTAAVNTAIQSSGVLAPLMGVNRGTLHKQQSSGYMYYWLELEGTDDNIEWLRRAAAAYGLFFCDDIGSLADSGKDVTRWIDNSMMCGTIDEDGRTNGDYTRGIQNVLQRQFDWSDSTASPFDPLLPPEPENTYSTQTVFNQIGDLTTMTHRYVLEAGAVENLGTALWTITSDLTVGQTDYSELNQKILDTFQSSNPIDCIVSLQRYPMNIPKSDSTLVKLGNYETVIPAHTMEKTVYVYLFEMKNKILPLFYDSFLDYEPYTHFELYIPFCGTTSIEPADILNRKLAVQLVVDFTTGTCTGYIMSDNLVIKTVNGQIAIDIPVSGLQQITAASQINNAIATAAAAQKQEIAATLGTVSISGITSLVLNPVKTLTNGQIAQINAQKAEYDLQHQNIQPHIIGAATSAAAWAIDLNCRLLIYYPTGEVITDTNPPAMKGQKLAEYGHTIGFACCLTGQLQDFSGLTVAVNADLNGITTNGLLARPATAQELQMLDAALNEGIII